MSRWNLGNDDSPGPTDSSHAEFDRSAGGARCRECNATVTGDSKFCPNCGARMQEVCFACGALSAGGAKFCGDCGADLIHGLETQVTLFEEKLGEAKQLLKGSGYDKVVETVVAAHRCQAPDPGPLCDGSPGVDLRVEKAQVGEGRGSQAGLSEGSGRREAERVSPGSEDLESD